MMAWQAVGFTSLIPVQETEAGGLVWTEPWESQSYRLRPYLKTKAKQTQPKVDGLTVLVLFR